MKKFFSLIAAVLFAGSMMATEVTVSKTVEELATANSWANGTVVTPFALDEVITVSTNATDANTGKYYTSGQQVRLYQSGAAELIISAAEGYTISSITLTYVSQNTGIFVEAESGVAVDFENVQSATFTVGNSGEATNGQARVTAISVTYNGEGGVTPPPADTYTVAGAPEEIFGAYWNPEFADNDMKKVGGIYTWEKAELELAPNDKIEFKVVKNHSWDVASYPAQNFEISADEEGVYTLKITFDPLTEEVEAVLEGAVVLADPTNCAEAAEAALSVSANNELYNDGKEYTIEGYVTSIAYAWKEGSMSFWMADTKEGGNVLEAYKCAIEKEEDAVRLGDKVAVTGKLTKYNTTPEFAAGCTVVIIERAEVIEPKNLGEKTIAEFLELKNFVDTCILTGTVANVKNTEYGNFDLVELGNAEVSVYVYGLLTAEGEAKKCFAEENIAEGDTLKVLAIYNEYNAAPQVKNAIFVEVKHLPVIADTIVIDIEEEVEYVDYVAAQGWWQFMAENDEYELSISNLYTTQAAGVYGIEDLDADYTYITVKATEEDILFVKGELTLTEGEDGSRTIEGAVTGSDGNVYIIKLVFRIPTAERVANVTISNGTLYDGYASAGLYAVYGTADDNTAYVQLAIWADTFSGDFTEEDLDFQYVGSGVQDADGSHSIFSAAITVTPGNGEGVYSITADLLCYNNTLYKVTMKIGEVQGINNVEDAVKAIKSIMNGQLLIEKNGKTFNAAGQMLK